MVMACCGGVMVIKINLGMNLKESIMYIVTAGEAESIAGDSNLRYLSRIKIAGETLVLTLTVKSTP